MTCPQCTDTIEYVDVRVAADDGLDVIATDLATRTAEHYAVKHPQCVGVETKAAIGCEVDVEGHRVDGAADIEAAGS